MNTYKCVVYDENKFRKVIKINAKSYLEISDYAIKNKLSIVNAKKLRNSNKKNQLSDKELSILCKQIGILIESGCELTNILNILANQSNKKVSNILTNISSQIQVGTNISNSFQSTKKFSKFFISMLETGELSGNLDKVMYSLSEYYAKEHKLKSKIIGIMSYPIILIVISIIVMLFMMVKIIPSFAQNFIDNNVEIPLMTKYLIGISLFTKDNFFNYKDIMILQKLWKSPV